MENNSVNHDSITFTAIIFVVENSIGNPVIKKGTYPKLDILAKRGSCGFLSVFNNCPDVITQLTGINHLGTDGFIREVGEIKLSVLKNSSTFDQYGDIISVSSKNNDEIYSMINDLIKPSHIIIVELKSLEDANEIIGGFLPRIDSENIAISLISGYREGSIIPTFPSPPVVDPSWRVIGADVVEALSIKKPMVFITASKNLTRIDNVASFDEKDIEDNNCMNALPICQYFREFSYYSGSSWKYGA